MSADFFNCVKFLRAQITAATSDRWCSSWGNALMDGKII
nr:MAG TPA: hypothetical protein [Caudoviricetes sp.]DAS69528.1 MAG TPA: hypothetical protein [Caudoviricetes sp.]